MSNDGIDYTESKLKEWTQKFDAIELENRIHYVIGGKDTEDIISYTEEQLDKLTPEECCSAAFICTQYTIEIQKKVNKARAIKNWATNNLDLIIGKEYNSYKSDKYIPAEVIKNQIILNNTYANRLNQIKNEAELTIDALFMLTNHLNTMITTLKNLAFMKKGEHVSYREN